MRYLLGLVVTLTSGVALAASPDNPSSEGSGLPQMDPSTFASQVFWMFVFFALLYILMAKFALPRVGNVVTNRANKIMSDLSEADELSKQTDEVKMYHEEAVNKSQDDAHDLLTKLHAEIMAKDLEEHKKLDDELSLQEKRSEQEITDAKEAALKDLEKAATSIAIEMANKIGGIAINDNDAAEAVKQQAKQK